MVSGPASLWSGAQWLLAGVVGLGLGAYAAAVSTLPPQWAVMLAMVAAAPFLAIVVGNLRRALLVIVILDIPLQFDTYLFYRQELEPVGALSGLYVSVTTLSLAGLYALWLAEGLSRGKPGSCPPLRISLPALLYFLVVAVSVVVASDVLLSLYDVWLLAQMLLLSFYVASWTRTRDDVVFIITMLLVVGLLEAAIMVGLQFLGGGVSIPGIPTSVDATSTGTGPARLEGTFGSPNYAGSFLSLLLAPALGVLLTRSSPRLKWLAAAAFTCGLVALILTFSRGSWVVFVSSALLLGAFTWRRGWLSPAIPVLGLVVTAGLGLLFGSSVLARLFEDDAGSAESRGPLLSIAFRMVGDNPLLGVGTNNFALHIEQYLTPSFDAEWVYVVHNKYMLVWAETGLVGLLAFVLVLLFTLRQGWTCWKLNDRLLSPIALAFTAVTGGMMVHMFVDIFNGRTLMLFWLFAGLLHGMARNVGTTCSK